MRLPAEPLTTIATLSLLLATSAPAMAEPNPHLAAAREAKAELRYDRALELVDEALRWGRNAPEQVADIYRLTGELEAGLDRAEAATRSFETLLALRPDASLPPGTSPKIVAPFERARAVAEERGPLSAHTEVTTAPRGVALIVDRDPLGLVAGARVRYRADDAEPAVVEGRGQSRIVVDVPGRRRLEARVAAIDEHGNVLLRFGSWSEPIVIPAPFAPPPDLPDDRVDRPHPKWPYAAGFTALALGAGVYFGLDSLAAEEDLDRLNEASQTMPVDAREVNELAERGERSALLSNVGFATAGVGAVVTGWLLLRRTSSEGPERIAVTPALDTNGGAIRVRLRF